VDAIAVESTAADCSAKLKLLVNRLSVSKTIATSTNVLLVYAFRS
jgi:hypothetical protein